MSKPNKNYFLGVVAQMKIIRPALGEQEIEIADEFADEAMNLSKGRGEITIESLYSFRDFYQALSCLECFSNFEKIKMHSAVVVFQREINSIENNHIEE